jgi:hypothetical protein
MVTFGSGSLITERKLQPKPHTHTHTHTHTQHSLTELYLNPQISFNVELKKNYSAKTALKSSTVEQL